MPPPYISGGLNVPSQYLNYQKSTRSQQQAKAGFFKVGLNRAREILNAAPPDKNSAKSAHKRQSHSLPPVFGATATEPRSRSAEKPSIIQNRVQIPRQPTFVIEDTQRGVRIDHLIEQRTQELQIRVKATMHAGYNLRRDKQFLELIQSTARSKSFVDIHVRDITQHALDYIDTRTIYWRQQIPDHVHRSTQHWLPDDEEDAPKSPLQHMHSVINKLNKINKMMSHSDYNYVIVAATKLMNDLKKMGNRLYGKESIMAVCCSILGNAWLESHDEKKAVSFHMQDYRLGSEYNIEVAKTRALDNLGRVYARIGKFKRAIQVWCKRLSSPSPMPPNEKAWLCHELGYCYLKTDEHEKGRQCGELSYRAGVETDDMVLQLNANILIVQAILHSAKLYGCRQNLEKTLKGAVHAGHRSTHEAVSDALKELRSAINRYKQVEREAKELERRSAFPPKSSRSTRSRYRSIYSSRETLFSRMSSKTVPNPQKSSMDLTAARGQSGTNSARSPKDAEAQDESEAQQETGATHSNQEATTLTQQVNNSNEDDPHT